MIETAQNRRIRVVVLGGGPVLEQGVKRFIYQLEEHPEIEFLGAYCQSEGQSIPAILRDLFRRRGFLAIPLFLLNQWSSAYRYLANQRQVKILDRRMHQLSSRIHFVPNIHAKEVLDEVRKLGPDLGLIYSSPILKPDLFEIPGFGSLGIHHGKAPKYRGKKTTFWEIYNGEAAAGVIIQKINAGLDTGDIVKQGEVPIGTRSLGAVWKDLEQLGIELFIQAIIEVKEDKVSYRPQVGQKGKLYRDPDFRQILTLWLRQFKRRIL